MVTLKQACPFLVSTCICWPPFLEHEYHFVVETLNSLSFLLRISLKLLFEWNSDFSSSLLGHTEYFPKKFSTYFSSGFWLHGS